MNHVPISAIVFDAGTQVREKINEEVVAQYAEAMESGAVFPAVVLFHDGSNYYIGDGYHRSLAAQRNKLDTIPADVHPGTKTDALWFALGANERNGLRLTTADKKHAILLALKTWPDKSSNHLAEQIGCAVSYVKTVKDQVFSTEHLASQRVTGKDGKSYPAARAPRGDRSERPERQRKGMPDRSPEAVEQRKVRMREMADGGYTSRQIAADVGLSEEGCRAIMRTAGIVVAADKVTKNAARHDANRITASIVIDAENLTADVKLIEFESLDPEQLSSWIQSLKQSRSALDSFIRQLTKEHHKHGEAA